MSERASHFHSTLAPSIVCLSLFALQPCKSYGRFMSIFGAILLAVAFCGSLLHTLDATYQLMAKMLGEAFSKYSLILLLFQCVVLKFGAFFTLLIFNQIVCGPAKFVHVTALINSSPHFIFNRLIYWIGQVLPCIFSLFVAFFMFYVESSIASETEDDYSTDAKVFFEEHVSYNFTHLISANLFLALNFVFIAAVWVTFLHMVLLFGIIMCAVVAIKGLIGKITSLRLRNGIRSAHLVGEFKAMCKEHMALCHLTSAINDYAGFTLLYVLAFDLPIVVLALYVLISLGTTFGMKLLIGVTVGTFITTEVPLVIAAAWLNEQMQHAFAALSSVVPFSGDNAHVDTILNGHVSRLCAKSYSVTCCGVFDISRSLIFTIVSVVLTYLALLLQLNIGGEPVLCDVAANVTIA